jgi:predicted  nucleic acid-binding Zn-ribbon protein
MATPEQARTRANGGDSPLEVELLDRLERQVAELTELRARVQTLEGALAAERKTRSEMSQRLQSERERVRKLQADLQALGADEEEVVALREQLAKERQSAVALGSQLEQAWTQLNDMRAAQHSGRGPFKRKNR